MSYSMKITQSQFLYLSEAKNFHYCIKCNAHAGRKVTWLRPMIIRALVLFVALHISLVIAKVDKQGVNKLVC